jgi:hypothetical protein
MGEGRVGCVRGALSVESAETVGNGRAGGSVETEVLLSVRGRDPATGNWGRAEAKGLAHDHPKTNLARTRPGGLRKKVK